MSPSFSACELYLEQCSKYQIAVDPAVVSCLETNWHILQVSPHNFHAGTLLPLVRVLQHAECSVRVLKLLPSAEHHACRMDTTCGDVDARCLNEIFAENQSITELDVTFMGLGVNGIKEIACVLMQKHSKLERLRLAHNPSAHRSAYKEIGKALKQNTTLRVLDISSNRLGYDTVQHLKRAAAKSNSGLEIVVHGNNVIEEQLNAVSHIAGLGLAMIAVSILLYLASNNMHAFWSCLVYGISLLSMLACSAIFHSHFDSHIDHFEFWNVLDHSAIYLLIAGSMLPFVAVRMNHLPLAVAVSVLQWCIAMFGIAFGMYATHHQMKHKLKIEVTVSVLQALMIGLLFEDLFPMVGEQVITFLALSTASYSLGLVFFLCERSIHPIFHAVWHLFVNAGAGMHYFAVLVFIMNENKTKEVCVL